MRWAVLDIETDGGPFDGRLLCVGLGDKAYQPRGSGWAHCLAQLEDETLAKVVWTKYDHRWLRLAGFTVRGPVIDVQAMAWAVNERTDLDLESCAKRYCNITMDKRLSSVGGRLMFKRDNGQTVPIAEAPLRQMLAYNERDLQATEALFIELRTHLASSELAAYYEQDVLPFTNVLLDMECRGVPVDLRGVKLLHERLSEECVELERWLRYSAGLPLDYNLGSSQQLAAYLYRRTFDLKRSLPITASQREGLLSLGTAGWLPRGFEVDKVGRSYVHGVQRLQGRGLDVHGMTPGGKPATDAKTLKVYHADDPWVQQYLELAQRRTVVSFLERFSEHAHDGRLYGRFNQTGTKTGRLSSSSPNLQNIPARGLLGKQVRELFRPEPGTVFVHGDYSQLEPRLMSHFSGDPVLRKVYDNGDDLYLTTAREVFNVSAEDALPYRDVMKTYVLALGYGSGAKTLRKTLAVAGHRFPLHEVEDTLRRLKAVYGVLFDWKESVIAHAQNEGYVETLAGHRRRFGGSERLSWKDQATDERQAVNAVIQGSAADIVARAMMQTDRAPLRLLAQVHDELLWECDRVTVATGGLDLAAVQHACERGHGFALASPLEFVPRIVGNWAEGKE